MAKSCDSLISGGPFKQTLFLGCSIISCTTSVGWNDQGTTLDVRLVDDGCPSTEGKLYYDEFLTPQLCYDADPGFLGTLYSIIGCPVYFRLGNFEFAGIIQNWNEENGQGGRPVYAVQLTDCRQLLENAKIILSGYSGSVGGLSNVFNVFGFAETFGDVSAPLMSLYNGSYIAGDGGPDGATFGSPAVNYGGANSNEVGMPWSNVLGAIKLLTSSVPKITNIWSTYGRITFKGPSVYGYGLLPADSSGLCEYLLDLSNLPTPPTYWRLGGIETSILNCINELCNDAGYDHYLELLPVNYDGNLLKIIKVRTVARKNQPALTSISSFIGNGDGAIQSRVGQELRNETTSAICFGGSKETLYQITGNNTTDDIILPYFGQDPWTNNTLIPYKDSMDQWCIDVDTTILNSSLNVLGPIGNNGYSGRKYAHITEQEMIAAISSYDTWLNMSSFLGQVIYPNATDFYAASTTNHAWSDIGSGINYYDMMNNTVIGIEEVTTNPLSSAHQLIYNIYESAKKSIRTTWDHLDVAHLINCQDRVLQLDQIDNRYKEELHFLHKWVAGFAENLGIAFQVRVPYVCARYEPDSYRIVMSEQPVQGGWTEQSYVLGMPRTDTFYNYLLLDDNKTSSLLVFADDDMLLKGKDITALGDTALLYGGNYFDGTGIYGTGHAPGSPGGYIYALAQVDENQGYVFEDYENALSPRAVLKIQGPIVISSGNNQYTSFIRQILQTEHDAKSLDGFNAAQIDIYHDNLKDLLTRIDIVENDIGHKQIFYPHASKPDTNPIGAAFGIKSNILSYGPWFVLGPGGGTKVIQDNDLVPWNYNGYTTLNIVGNSRASEGLTSMQIGEQGSISVCGYPAVPLGAELGAMAGGFYAGGNHLVESRVIALDTFQGSNFGYIDLPPWVGTYGPNITNMNISMGPQGVTTEYSMRTYTPKFGHFTKQNSDRLKTLAATNRKFQHLQAKRAKTYITNSYNQNIRAGNIPYRISATDAGIHYANQTAHLVMMGQLNIVGTGVSGIGMTTVVSNPLVDIKTENINYDKKALLSMDGLFRPISLYGDGNLPRLAQPDDSEYAILPAIPPMRIPSGTGPGSVNTVLTSGNWIYNNIISSSYTHPFQNPSGMKSDWLVNERSISGLSGLGHDIKIVGKYSSINNQFVTQSIDGTFSTGNYADDYRTLALRGPLMLQGWGYDLDGKPIPNAADTYANASGGIFTTGNLQDYFMRDWLQKPQTWPVAPVDLRYDRNRGVWTAPPPYSILSASLISDISASGSGTGILIDDFPMYNSTGLLLKNTGVYLPIMDTLGKTYSSGDNVVVSWNGRKHQYFILAAGTNDGIIPIKNVTENMLVWDATTEEYVTDADKTIPAYGVVQLDVGYSSNMNNTQNTWYAPVIKPEVPFQQHMYINGATPISYSKTGKAFDNSKGPVLFYYTLTAGYTHPLPGYEMGPTHRNWYLSQKYPSIMTVLGVVHSGELDGLAYGQWHELRGGPDLVGRVTSPVYLSTTWFTIDSVSAIDYQGIVYTNTDGEVDVFNPGSDENTPRGLCIDQGVTIRVTWDSTLKDDSGASKPGYIVFISPCALGCIG